MILFPIFVKARYVQVGGIYYDVNSETKEAIVTRKQGTYGPIDNCYSGSVKIPSSITYNGISYNVTRINSCAFIGCYALTSVTIPNSVTSIGASAFQACSVNSITIPNSVITIGDEAFYGCTGLTSAIIGNAVISIGYGAFRGCSHLTTITIPSSVTSIGDMAFYGCI